MIALPFDGMPYVEPSGPITREWRALASLAGAHAYLAHFDRHVVPVLASTKGFLGATVLTRQAEDGLVVVVQTRWDCRQSIVAFAGEDIEKAVVHPDAARHLLSFDRHATHWLVERSL